MNIVAEKGQRKAEWKKNDLIKKGVFVEIMTDTETCADHTNMGPRQDNYVIENDRPILQSLVYHYP